MPRSILPAFLRSPEQLRIRVEAVETERDQLKRQVKELEEKAAQYCQMFLSSRTEVVTLKAMLEARGIAIPEPRRKVLAIRPRGALA